MSALSAAALAWCERHAIDPDVLERFDVVERGGFVALPNGRQVSLNGRGPKVRQPSGQPLAMWWPNGEPVDGDTILITEGEADALAALSVSPTLKVGAMPGTGYKPARLADDLRGANAILAFDGDDPGREATERATRALSAAGITVHLASIPEGKDLADVLAAVTLPQRRRALEHLLGDARQVETRHHERWEKHRELAGLLGLDAIGRSVEVVRIVGRGSRATVTIELDDESTIFFEPIGAVASTTKLTTELAMQVGATPMLKAPEVTRVLKLIHDLGALEPTIEIEDRARDVGAQYLARAVTDAARMDDQSERWEAFVRLARASERSSLAQRFVIEDPVTGLRYVRIDWLRSFIRSEGELEVEKIVRAMPLVGWSKPGTEGRIKATEKVGRRTLQWSFFIVPGGWS